ncbi:uncharacterized protein ACLA_080450 [Aspergillus clavatus NRRL 1]|uniref:Antifungal protein Afp n=1 Tax=Aspergillus clavatus (strain ATCC 1007 / CBS 513.65 / DSM 816 / NCTC 3887 / NRRL 1 / QM 1276 / 107) TaxID=344612 RepID=A1CSS4_ASPCL|nr:antifungal protein Afp [Aspergillus clavatus NRRL 1]EAW06361.1 antifungal protein Afp [Aspergillus clavatus NRRL 1]
MKVVSLASLGFALVAALGVVASPVDADSLAAGGLDARDESAVQATYDGKCYKKDNICKYKAQSGKTAICKCYVKVCPRDGAKCEFDSYKGKCYC